MDQVLAGYSSTSPVEETKAASAMSLGRSEWERNRTEEQYWNTVNRIIKVAKMSVVQKRKSSKRGRPTPGHTRFEAPPEMKTRLWTDSDTRAHLPSTLPGITPHPIPYLTWLQITTSNLPTYWVAFFPLAPGESHKIQAFHRFSRFVLLEHPPSLFCSPSAMDEHSFYVGERDITNCTHINFLCHFGSLIPFKIYASKIWDSRPRSATL